MAEENIGKVISVSGPAVDVQFNEAKMPPIYQAIRVTSDGFDVPQPLDVILEVQQHLGEGRVRCIAMTATEGMVRGMKATDTGGIVIINQLDVVITVRTSVSPTTSFATSR